MKKILIILLTLLGLAINYSCFVENGVVVSFNQQVQSDLEYKIFYTRGEETVFGKNNVIIVKAHPDQKNIQIEIPSKKCIKIKVDLDENPRNIILSDFKINHKKLDLTKFKGNDDIQKMYLESDQLVIQSNGANPSIIYQEDLNIKNGRIIRYGILLLFLIICFVASCVIISLIKSHSDKIDVLFVILFAVILSIPMSKISNQEISSQENRRLAVLPSFQMDGKLNEKYGPQFDTYFNDRFKGRDGFINVYNHLISYINLKPYSRAALYGKDGWLFSKGHGAVEMYKNNNLFSQKQLQMIGQNLNNFVKSAQQKGIKNIYFLLNNDKESIYGAFYPTSVKKVNKISRLEQVLAYMHENYPQIKVLNFKDQLDRLKENDVLFYKTGTHMNQIGSFHNYTLIMQEIKKDYPNLPILSLDDYTITESDSFDQPGLDLDTYNSFKFVKPYAKENIKNKILTLKNAHAVQAYTKSYDHIALTVWKNKSLKNKHSAFVLGDSFSERDIDKYTETFSNLKHIFVGGGGDFNIFDLMEDENQELFKNPPQIMIIESTERFLDRFLTLKFPKD